MCDFDDWAGVLWKYGLVVHIFCRVGDGTQGLHNLAKCSTPELEGEPGML